MATKQHVNVYDDLAGSAAEVPADETVSFGLDGRSYEIDLTFDNAAKFRKDMAPYTAVARLAPRTPRHKPRNQASRDRSSEIRAWAKKEGYEFSERGRIPAHIIAKYDAAH